MASLFVVKFNGEREPFSLKKVYQSAKRTGASEKLAKKIAEEVEKEIYPGVKTSEIFKKVKKLLKQKTPKTALKFNLKEGIKKLGPTGFPFEKYIGEIFSRNGFKVKLNQHISGFCCRYEIDFLARKGNVLYVGECKYRNLEKGKVHSDIALANYARFLDIKKGKFFNKELKIKSLLVTNRKFTSKAVRYSNCVGVELLGWNYPKKRGLEYLIGNQELYPITILPSLSKYLAEMFASRKIMLAKDILEIDPKKLSKKINAPKNKIEALKKEAKILFSNN